MGKYLGSIYGSHGDTPQAAEIWNVEAHCSGNVLCPPTTTTERLLVWSVPNSQPLTTTSVTYTHRIDRCLEYITSV